MIHTLFLFLLLVVVANALYLNVPNRFVFNGSTLLAASSSYPSNGNRFRTFQADITSTNGLPWSIWYSFVDVNGDNNDAYVHALDVETMQPYARRFALQGSPSNNYEVRGLLHYQNIIVVSYKVEALLSCPQQFRHYIARYTSVTDALTGSTDIVLSSTLNLGDWVTGASGHIERWSGSSSYIVTDTGILVRALNPSLSLLASIQVTLASKTAGAMVVRDTVGVYTVFAFGTHAYRVEVGGAGAPRPYASVYYPINVGSVVALQAIYVESPGSTVYASTYQAALVAGTDGIVCARISQAQPFDVTLYMAMEPEYTMTAAVVDGVARLIYQVYRQKATFELRFRILRTSDLVVVDGSVRTLSYQSTPTYSITPILLNRVDGTLSVVVPEHNQVADSYPYRLVRYLLSGCAAGYYYSSTTLVCDSCPRGQYQSTDGNEACINCPAGTYIPTTDGRSNSIDTCLACPAGTYSTAGSMACTTCNVSDVCLGATRSSAGTLGAYTNQRNVDDASSTAVTAPNDAGVTTIAFTTLLLAWAVAALVAVLSSSTSLCHRILSRIDIPFSREHKIPAGAYVRNTPNAMGGIFFLLMIALCTAFITVAVYDYTHHNEEHTRSLRTHTVAPVSSTIALQVSVPDVQCNCAGTNITVDDHNAYKSSTTPPSFTSCTPGPTNNNGCVYKWWCSQCSLLSSVLLEVVLPPGSWCSSFEYSVTADSGVPGVSSLLEQRVVVASGSVFTGTGTRVNMIAVPTFYNHYYGADSSGSGYAFSFQSVDPRNEVAITAQSFANSLLSLRFAISLFQTEEHFNVTQRVTIVELFSQFLGVAAGVLLGCRLLMKLFEGVIMHNNNKQKNKNINGGESEDSLNKPPPEHQSSSQLRSSAAVELALPSRFVLEYPDVDEETR